MKKLALFTVLAVVAATVGAAAPAAPAAEDDVIRIPPKDGGWEIEQLVRSISEYTGQNIVYEPQNPAVRGRKLHWSGTVELSREKLFPWLRAQLYFQRLVLVPNGPAEANQWLLLELNATQVSGHPVTVSENELEKWADADGVYITTTLTLEHLTDTSRARNALSQLSTRPNGTVNDVPGSRSFVIADFAPVVVAMAHLLRKLDVAAANAPVEGSREYQEEKRRLEQALIGSRTQVAAQYFLNEIRALDAR